MSQALKQKRQALIDAVARAAKKQITGTQAKLLATFISLFYQNLSLEDLEARGIDNLCGAATSLWKMLYQRKPGQLKLRVFNPELKKHGWTSTHTILQLAQDDMPFLIDSLRMELSRLGYTVHWNVHLGGVQFRRDTASKVVEVLPIESPLGSGQSGAPIYMEIDRCSKKEELELIQENLDRILNDVRLAVEDWQAMRNKAEDALEALETLTGKSLDLTELSETKDFLRWMIHDNFIFLGSRDYILKGKAQKQGLAVTPDSGYGVLRDRDHRQPMRLFAEMPKEVRSLIQSPQILIIAKSNTIATVHRPVHTDYISVKLYDEKSQVVGERRFVGLFTSGAYNSNPKHIPFLRNKVRQVMAMSHLWPTGHAAKALLNILETFPRDDLFQTNVDELFDIAMNILQMQERNMVRLFVRKDIYGRFMSCLAYVPREQFNPGLRQRIQIVLEDAFGSHEVTFNTTFNDSILARIHFMIRLDPLNSLKIDVHALEQKVIEVARSWRSKLIDELHALFDEEMANNMASLYSEAFPAGYREKVSPAAAVIDIQRIEAMPEHRRLEMRLYEPNENTDKRLRFKLFRPDFTAPLSDALPILESMGLRVIGEEPYKLVRKDGKVFWINDFNLAYPEHCCFNIEDIRSNFKEAFRRTWFKDCEDDEFNALVLVAKLDWREVSLLRAYAKHMLQTGFTYSQDYIAKTLVAYPDIAKQLISLFKLGFIPAKALPTPAKMSAGKRQLEKALDNVSNLDRDRILRRYADMINATLRTNFFQLDKQGNSKSYISLKLSPGKIPGLPLPLPKYEIFVYSPRFEGVHLRAAKVARGGLRWSDRPEDFRTEVLGLMKAQQVKNAVIVPQGAKGGFVPKHLPKDRNRDAILQEGVICYQDFISGLLDVTDNLNKGKVVHPENVMCFDDDDPYLVVAADKGTATFSDIANHVAKGYGFWLGDAFASGGSVGYDHKKMGITARGAWESVKRHFRHMGHNTQTTPFTVVGIGDMAGDVFGNGMLLSKQIKLVAAFNHMHIFLDPDPDVVTSYQERKRLFKQPRTSWADYNAELISKGGGVFERSAKCIILSPEIKNLLETKKDSMEPNELIRAMLKAPVDLLWNGGIGTFLKASSENNAEVGDKTNDLIRINGDEARFKVIGEGGNLGATQLGRIEFSLNGGHVYADFIDNSAGVDCSDHEVNIKILLNQIVQTGDLDKDERDALLMSMSDNVASLVLENNYFQTQALEISMHNPVQTVEMYTRYMGELERAGAVDKTLEFLPSNKTLLERKAIGKGLTRPEISVLLAYSKNILKQNLLGSDVLEEESMLGLIKYAFPEALHDRFESEMQQHSLRREIIATLLSSLIVNSMGLTFSSRLHHETGSDVGNMARAFAVVEHAFERKALWLSVEALDNKISADIQVKLLLEAYRVMQRMCRWFLRNRRQGGIDIQHEIKAFHQGISEAKQLLPDVICGREATRRSSTQKLYQQVGVPKKIATLMANTQMLYPVCDMVDQSTQHKIKLEKLMGMYYLLGEAFDLSWFRDCIYRLPVDNHWESLASASLRDDLDRWQCKLSVSVLKNASRQKTPDACLDAWMVKHADFLGQWENRAADLKRSTQIDFTILLVAMRELIDLCHSHAIG